MPTINDDQFSAFLRTHLGPESDPEHHEDVPDTVPAHVFRVVSDEDYRQSMERGYMRSDERNNWQAQQARGDTPAGLGELPAEGTVAGRWVEPGYFPEKAPGRVVKFDTSAHPEWEVHPEVGGEYIRTHGRIPMSSAVAVTPPITLHRGQSWTYRIGEDR